MANSIDRASSVFGMEAISFIRYIRSLLDKIPQVKEKIRQPDEDNIAGEDANVEDEPKFID